jgi:hypothetical protein
MLNANQKPVILAMFNRPKNRAAACACAIAMPGDASSFGAVRPSVSYTEGYELGILRKEGS